MLRRPRFVSALLLGLVSGAGWSAAHEGATGIVGERMKAMSRLADEMKVFTRLIKDNTAPFPDIARRAKTIQELGRNMPAMFPPDSAKGPHTEAKQAIWQKWSEFEALSKQFERYAAELVEAADGGDRTKVRATFTAMAQTCGSCHERFRIVRHRH